VFIQTNLWWLKGLIERLKRLLNSLPSLQDHKHENLAYDELLKNTPLPLWERIKVRGKRSAITLRREKHITPTVSNAKEFSSFSLSERG